MVRNRTSVGSSSTPASARSRPTTREAGPAGAGGAPAPGGEGRARDVNGPQHAGTAGLAPRRCMRSEADERPRRDRPDRTKNLLQAPDGDGVFAAAPPHQLIHIL